MPFVYAWKTYVNMQVDCEDILWSCLHGNPQALQPLAESVPWFHELLVWWVKSKMLVEALFRPEIEEA